MTFLFFNFPCEQENLEQESVIHNIILDFSILYPIFLYGLHIFEIYTAGV